METKTAWAVIGNSDLTEGRGRSLILGIYLCKASAIRAAHKNYVMGSNCPIDQVELVKRNSIWYGPVDLIQPTKEDEKAQFEMDKRDFAIGKAKNLGMTEEDLRAMGIF